MAIADTIQAADDDGELHDSNSGELQPSSGDEKWKLAARAWARGFHQLRGDSADSPEEREADRERIACLEAIITDLIEKNERMRQQLIGSLR